MTNLDDTSTDESDPDEEENNAGQNRKRKRVSTAKDGKGGLRNKRKDGHGKPSDANGTEEGSTQPAPEPNKKQKLMKEITQNSRPCTEIESRVAVMMKKIVDRKMFPWSKYLMTAKEVESGFVQMAMVELGWKEHSAKHVVKRAWSWHLLVDCIIKRSADHRHAAVAAIKKACTGEHCM